MHAIYPVSNWASVTPSDTARLSGGRCRAILIGVGGNVAVRNEDGTTTTLVGLVAGGLYPVSTDQILSTGTTATSIVAGYDSPNLS